MTIEEVRRAFNAELITDPLIIGALKRIQSSDVSAWPPIKSTQAGASDQSEGK